MLRRQIIQITLPLALTFKIRGSQAQSSFKEWIFDNDNEVSDYKIHRSGSPVIISTFLGDATWFNGKNDGYFMTIHPLAGAKKFTIEALIRPDGGNFEQRWLHLESQDDLSAPPGLSDTRILYEIRVIGSYWYPDAFIHGEGYRQALRQPDRLWPTGQWHHVAQTYDGSTYRSYVNGTLQCLADVAFTPQGAGRCAVGVRLNKVNFFHGAIRSIRFSRYASDPSQFALLKHLRG